MTAAPETDVQRVYREASDWIVLGDDRPLTGEEEAAFERWRCADPRHERVYRAMLATWDEVPDASRLVPADALRADNVVPFTPAPDGPSIMPPARPRLWALALGAAAAVLLALLIVPAVWPPRGGASYETALAEQRVVRLSDGSQVTLGPRTTIRVDFTNDARRVVLSGGEAFFEVAHNANRPFLVEAGSSIIRVVGTKFDVNVGGASVRVAVLEGAVQVSEPRTQRDIARILRGGQRIEIPLATRAAPTPVATAAPAVVPATQPPGAWRQGHFMYDDVRLADLIADVNRYYAPGAALDDPALGEVRVTAFFNQNEIPAFLGSLPDIVPVRSTENRDGSFRISPSSHRTPPPR